MAFFLHDTNGFLTISGEDRFEFLQRQTTNDINQLTPEKPLVTVLTSPTARILDVLTLIEESDYLLAITMPGHRYETLTYLRSRIFFNDRVSVDDQSESMTMIELAGPDSSELLPRLGASKASEREYIQPTNIASSPGRIYFHRELGLHLLFPAESTPDVLAELRDIGVDRLSQQEFEILRVEAGRPAAGHELSDEYTPLETGLQWAISDNKGCYTGQEIIARQVTYDKIKRQMVGLFLIKIPQTGNTIWSRDKNQTIGKITSTALSPRFGPIALGIIKRPYNKPGTEIHTGEEFNHIIGKVCSLPFQDSP